MQTSAHNLFNLAISLLPHVASSVAVACFKTTVNAWHGRQSTVAGAQTMMTTADAVQVKNSGRLPAAPGPARMEDLPDPCASALNIPKV